MARFPDMFDPVISERSVALRESAAARHAGGVSGEEPECLNPPEFQRETSCMIN